MAREIKADTQELLNDTNAIKEDTAQILAEIARLQEQLPRDAQRDHGSGFMLERYLDNLTSYAETVYDTFSDDTDERRGSENGSIKQQRSTSPSSRSSSASGEAQINENAQAPPSIAPPAPEAREEKLEALIEYPIPEQDAASMAREQTVEGLLQNFSTQLEHQEIASNHDYVLPRYLDSPIRASAAESNPEPNKDNARRTKDLDLDTLRAEGFTITYPNFWHPPTSTSSPSIISPREIMQRRAAREASQTIARNPNIAAPIAQTNSLQGDSQRQIANVNQTKIVYRRPRRELMGVEDLSPGTDQNQSDGNAPLQTRSATRRAEGHGHSLRERPSMRRPRPEALQEANNSRKEGEDSSKVSDTPTTSVASSTDIKPIFFKGLFSVSATSTRPVKAICVEVERVLNQLAVKYSEIRGGFSCRLERSKDLETGGNTLAAGHPRKISFGGMESRDLSLKGSDAEPFDSDISPHIRRTPEQMITEFGGSMILEFKILIIKVPLLSMHGISFQKIGGGAWQYKYMADSILQELRL